MAVSPTMARAQAAAARARARGGYADAASPTGAPGNDSLYSLAGVLGGGGLFSTPDPSPPTTYEDPTPYADPGPQGPQGPQGVASAPPQRELASSPEWLAYLNELGLSRDQFTADITRQREVSKSLAAQQAADITAQGPGARRNITGNLETRGMARSGQLVRGLAEQRAGEGRAQGQVQAGLTGSLSGLESSLAQKLIDLHQQQVQQELSLKSGGGYF